MRRLCILVLTLFSLVAAADMGDPGFIEYTAETIAIDNVRLFDGTGAPAQLSQTVLIRGGRIAAIGTSLDVPADAIRIDGSGSTLMPGLVMVHEHLYYFSNSDDFEDPISNDAAAVLYLAGGVTTARTAGSFHPSIDIQLKKQIERGIRVGPDLDVSVYLMGNEPIFKETLGLGFENAEQVRKAVQHWASRGAGSIKLFMSLPPELAQAASEEASALGLGIAGHLCATGARQAVDFGLDTLEHGYFSAHDLVDSYKPGECTGESFKNLIELLSSTEPGSPAIQGLQNLMLAKNVAITPTFAAVGGDLCDGYELSDEALAVVTENVRRAYRSKLSSCHERVASGEIEFNRALDRALGRLALEYYRAGGRILAGSDAADVGLVPGFSNHRELERFVHHGFTAVETLVIATRSGAEQLGLLSDRGTVELGKRADLLLVAGNPDQDISDIRNVKVVFKAGIGYDPKLLRASVPDSIE